MHVGFWRPDTAAMAALVEPHPGMLLLSEAAIHALPGPIAVSKSVVGQIDGLAFRLALSSFGYEVAADAAASGAGSIASGSASDDARGWVGDLGTIDPDLPVAAASLGIWDDESYSEREGALEYDVRQKLGFARFVLLTGLQPGQENILDNIRACPAWFRANRLHRLQLTVRQTNVFRAHGIVTVDDVGRLGTSGLFKLNNLGRKSVNELAVALYRSMLDGPPRALIDLNAGTDTALVAAQGINERVAALESSAQRSSGIRCAIVDAVQLLKGQRARRLGCEDGFWLRPADTARNFRLGRRYPRTDDRAQVAARRPEA